MLNKKSLHRTQDNCTTRITTKRASRKRNFHFVFASERREEACKQRLPSEVRESLVGLGHAMHLITLLDRITLVLSSQEELRSELVGHRLTLLCARCVDQPTKG